MSKGEGLLNEVSRRILRTRYSSFVRHAFRYLRNGSELSDDPYIDFVCEAVQDGLTGNTKKLILNMPPRHGKTLIATKCAAAWTLGHSPGSQVMVLSYADEVARDIAYDIRRIMQSSWFQQTFSSRIADDRSRVEDFVTTDGGGLFASPIAGNVTGRGADLLIIDDPHKIEDASSPAALDKVAILFDTVVGNRFNDPSTGRILLVAHRLHRDDLSGRLLQDGDWSHLGLPLIAEEPHTYESGDVSWSRDAGELLRKEAFSASALKRLQNLLEPPDYQTLYQQTPPGENIQIKVEDFPLFEQYPAGLGGVVLSIDTARGLSKRNSYSVCQTWLPVNGKHYLIDAWRERVDAEVLFKEIRRRIRRYQPGLVLIENTEAGPALIPRLRNVFRGQGISIVPVETHGESKLKRLANVIAIIKSKSVLLPETALWREEFTEEMITFPDGWSDDHIDAMTQYLASIGAHPTLRPPPPRVVCAIGNTRRGVTTVFATSMPGGRAHVWYPRRKK